MQPSDATPIVFETRPEDYKHLRVQVDGPIAQITIAVAEDGGLHSGYELKLNSYDLGVDIELHDAVTRMRFERPEVACVVIGSGLSGVFSSGANIFMLGRSSHGFKVNFCKYTNETRLGMEDASRHSKQVYVAAINGVCSGGGYELALACEAICLVDDRRSAVSLPEVPYLGVLPGTGGLTRLVDKRMLPRDRADVFCTVAEGLKGKRAKQWGLVDHLLPGSRFEAEILRITQDIAGEGNGGCIGIALDSLAPTVSEESIVYRHLQLDFSTEEVGRRLCTMTITIPDSCGAPDSADWLPLRLFRELDDALCQLRFNRPECGLVLLQTRGNKASVREFDAALAAATDDGPWFLREVRLLMKRVLKRMDMTAKSFYAVVDEGSCFVGSLLEMAWAADRVYMQDNDSTSIELTSMNSGALPMGNGLSRLQSRLLGDTDSAARLQQQAGCFSAEEAEQAKLVTLVFDELDWQDEVRLATEERLSLSPDALTGMEASLRFAGPETMETKIFARLSAWQNWIFQRPNAVGEKGALSLYGQPQSPEFDWRRT